MNIIQKYKTYKDLKNYLDKHYEQVELVTECPKIDICRHENHYCFYDNLVGKPCMSYEIKTDGLNANAAMYRIGYRRPMDDVQFKVNIVNKDGVLPNIPKFVVSGKKSLTMYVYNLFVEAYRRKLVAERAKFYHG